MVQCIRSQTMSSFCLHDNLQVFQRIIPSISLLVQLTADSGSEHVIHQQRHSSVRSCNVPQLFVPLTETAAPSLLPFRVRRWERLTLVTLSVKWTLTFVSAQTRLNKRWWAINLVLHLFQFPASLSLLHGRRGPPIPRKYPPRPPSHV